MKKAATTTAPASESQAEKLALKKAKSDMKKYAKVMAEMATLKESIKSPLDKLSNKAKELTEELAVFGDAMRSKFDAKGRYDLGQGYLLIANNAKIETKEDFDIVEFSEDFPEMVEMSLKLKPIKDAWLNDEEREQIQEAGVTLCTEKPIEVKLYKK